ncbi:MAG: hypothetical protein M1812_001306 [Candelaria pacifica]|nr:MAG: hypothetical protein M1812_001306 [Candelaria pacifica]
MFVISPSSLSLPRSLVVRILCTFLFRAILVSTDPSTPVIVKNVTQLGPQVSPGITDLSRDGGYSVLINGHITWLYDDTECLSQDGSQLSFVSNTAAYASNTGNISMVEDFGIVMVGEDKYGRQQNAILGDKSVGDGGWVPFNNDELTFNTKRKGTERVAICKDPLFKPYNTASNTYSSGPGTSPTLISTKQAFMYAPLVYVDSKPQDPTKLYQPRGMTLMSILAPDSGPQAARLGDLIFPGDEIQFGGFATLLGFPSTETAASRATDDRDIYLLGVTDAGLQLSRVTLDDIKNQSKYTYFHPRFSNFTEKIPDMGIVDESNIYLPGSFSAGSVFFSPYFQTFLLVYFNRMVDSTFYIRYLDLDQPTEDSELWIKGGKNGKGIQHEDAEALIRYVWAPEQKLYVSPQEQGGFNYAGQAHPEYFNRQSLAPSLWPNKTPASNRKTDWYGGSVLKESDAGGDGRHLLLSWTAQKRGGFDAGLYEIQLAKVEFDAIPSSTTASFVPPKANTTAKSEGYSIGSYFNMGLQKDHNRWAVLSQLVVLGGIIVGVAALL